MAVLYFWKLNELNLLYVSWIPGTKLRIRDSLYRLARSAEQRNRNASLNGGSIDDRDASRAFMAEETNKYAITACFALNVICCEICCHGDKLLLFFLYHAYVIPWALEVLHLFLCDSTDSDPYFS